LFCVACVVLLGRSRLATAASPDRTVEFNRDIRPILSDVCYQCHGPDQAKRKAKLRLDTKEGAFADLGGRRALVPGDLENSELYRRITSEDDDERMPPPSSGRTLSRQQVELMKRWIEQGTKWQQHWSLITPRRPPLPRPKGAAWLRNAVDAFILDRLEHEGLTPAPEADRTTLIRRLTLDLTSLPPTPGEVDAFLADNSPAAYEKVVDRLLASPHFGERMAMRWLDGARYADSNGYQTDGERTMWRWRDWVIEAFNRNLPFDEFTVEQVAGDMLPAATLDQKIASGFNRNHRGNGEGGIIPEEYLVEYVVDRVETTATVWLGLTLGCARCHDHKFDPITQQEFYQVFAYFNNIPERGRANKYGNSPPMIQAPTRDQQEQLTGFDGRIEAAQHELHVLEPELERAQAEWEKTRDASHSDDWSPSDGLLARYALDGDATDRSGHGKEGKFHGGKPAYTFGQLGKAGAFDGTRFIDVGDVGAFGFFDRFSCGAWVYPDGDQGGAILSRMTDTDISNGYNLHLEAGRVQVNMAARWLDDSLRVETVNRLSAHRWHHVMMTYDGSRVARGIKIYVDGRPQPLRVILDELNQSFTAKEPLRIGSRGTKLRFHGAIDDVRIYRGVLPPDDVALLATVDSISDIVAIPPDQRDARQARKLRAYFLETRAPERVRRARDKLTELRRRKHQLVDSFPTTMVMEELKTPRATCVLIRGQYDKPGKRVAAGIPASLPPLPKGVRNDRLGFAWWLVDPSHPLTARVAINRAWQMVFGAGLVQTVGDFGSQGESPSHPDLLDWLATEFIRTGWDVKALQKLIVMSATYRQSSKATPEALRKDPENRLLARGSRWRLPAEAIRDQALAASGLLARALSGPSVKPYQPAGLGKDLNDEDYQQDRGAKLYRRSLYTFWKRTVAPPSMVTFDAAGRETCIVRETRTNTPLQALTLLNDVTFVEAARVLAQRVLAEAGPSPEERITLAFRLVTARRPKPAEMTILLAELHDHLSLYRAHPADAAALIDIGEFPRDTQLDTSELAAYTTVASLILNLDETITKE
jgi:hypothetical protein